MKWTEAASQAEIISSEKTPRIGTTGYEDKVVALFGKESWTVGRAIGAQKNVTIVTRDNNVDDLRHVRHGKLSDYRNQCTATRDAQVSIDRILYTQDSEPCI